MLFFDRHSLVKVVSLSTREQLKKSFLVNAFKLFTVILLGFGCRRDLLRIDGGCRCLRLGFLGVALSETILCQVLDDTC